LSVRFTIINSTGNTLYQEVHNTKNRCLWNDKFDDRSGFFSIGNFTEIVWDGSRKDLKVEINLDGIIIFDSFSCLSPARCIASGDFKVSSEAAHEKTHKGGAPI
jgi:hypothetical protein